MSGLIIIIITIALLSILLFAGGSHIDFNSVSLMKDKAQIESSFISIDSGIAKYHIINNEYPNKKEDLLPAYLSRLALPTYLTLDSIDKDINLGHVRICVSGIVEDNQYSVVNEISKSYEQGSFYISDTCGGEALIPATYPSEIIINYIIR